MRELEDELLKTIKDETERAIAQRELAGQREIEDLRKRLATERNLQPPQGRQYLIQLS